MKGIMTKFDRWCRHGVLYKDNVLQCAICFREMAEANEQRTVSATGGEKGVKPARFSLIPTEPLWQLAELYGKGAGKYSARNWEKGYEWSKSYDALMRHVNLFWDGEDDDPELKVPHLTCAVFHAFALLEFMITHPEYDDRPKSD